MKRFSKNFSYAAMSLLLCSGASVWAQGHAPKHSISGFVHVPTQTMHMVVEENDEVPNVCDNYIQRMEYLSSLKTLVLTVARQHSCHTDVVGKRKAELKWVLPRSLRTKGQFCLVVNQRKLGMVSIAESRQVTISHNEQGCGQ